MKTGLKRGAAFLLIALLSGCASDSGLVRSSLKGSADAEDALALPPPGGPAVVGIVEQRFSNGIQQDIILGTQSSVSGQNMLRVQLIGPVDRGGDSALPNPRLAETSFVREMRQMIPGVAMQRSGFYAQNQYGPFGYAVGRAATSDLCLFAWQRIDAPAHYSRFFGNRGAYQIRLRLCERGATEESLLSVMYGFSLTSFPGEQSWNPFGAPPPLDPDLGRTGSPIYPRGQIRRETVVAPVAPQPPAAAPALRRSASPPPAPVIERPEAIGPRVPTPGLSSSRAVDRSPAAAPASAAPTVPAPPAAPGPPPAVSAPPPAATVPSGGNSSAPTVPLPPLPQPTEPRSPRAQETINPN